MSLGVLNKSLMNEAVYKFRRFEESSLSYAGVNMHEGESVGLFSAELLCADHDQLSRQQRASIQLPARGDDDRPEPAALRAKTRSDDVDDEGDIDEMEEADSVPAPKDEPAPSSAVLEPSPAGGEFPGVIVGAKMRQNFGG